MVNTDKSVVEESSLGLAGQRRWNNALTLLYEAAIMGSDDYLIYFRLGHSLSTIKDHVNAAKAYGHAAQRNPTNPELLLYQASSLQRAKLISEAEETFRTLNRLHPDYFSGWSLHGVFLKNQERFSEAITVLRKALSIRNDIDTRNTLVVCLSRLKMDSEAIREGKINLTEKDRLAIQRFNAEAKKSAQLAEHNPPFNPYNKEKNIISFSLWGDKPVYVHGAIANARIAPNLYYGWTCRFYCDESVPEDAVSILEREGAQVVRVTEPALKEYKPLWRFLASDDPLIDRFICRDTDSRLNGQELIAVEDWLRSHKRFHIMRDHIYHMELILAGMWGGVAGVIPNIKETILSNKMYSENRFGDQAFLMNEVWPLVRDDMVTHDSVYGFLGSDFPNAYRLPRPIHVGGAIKNMQHWRSQH